MDTDSNLFKTSKDPYEIMLENSEEFDTNDYSSNILLII